MSALSEYIKSKRENRYGTDQDVQDYIMQSNGSWYHSPYEGDNSSTAYDLASIVGGSALSGVGDMATALGTISKDLDNKLYPEYVRNSATSNPLSDWLINNGQHLSNTGADITARHMKQGKAPEGKSWGDMGFLERASNLDYWTDPYGVGADAAVMGGSLASQLPLMAVTPELGVAKAAGGLLGKLGGKLFTRAPRNTNAFTQAGNTASKAIKNLGHGLKSNTATSMENWAVKTAPQTALTNAGGIYGDLKEQGYTDEQIANNMYGMMTEEIPQDFVTGALTGLALSGKLGKIAGAKTRPRQFVQNFGINAPLEAASEYYDEANQQRLQNKYSNKPYGEDILHLLPDEAAAGATAVAPSLIPGLAGGARNVITRGRTLRETYNDWKNNRRQAINNQIQATNNAITGTNTTGSQAGANQAGNNIAKVAQTIANTNQIITQSVNNANSAANSMATQPVASNIPQTISIPQPTPQNASSNVRNAAIPFIGQRMDNGENGCVEAVTKIGASINGFLQKELDNGVVGVPKLVEDAKNGGINVVTYNPSNVAAGDIIVYGDNDHVVMADGKGGYVGNSSSQQRVVSGDDYTQMGGLQPTKIIKTSNDTVIAGNNTGNASGGSYSGNADIDNAINTAASKYSLDPALVAAVAQQESNFDQSAGSSAGAMGVMQLTAGTAESLGVDPNDLNGNIEGGAKYLRQMLDRYNGDVKKALAAYNGGPTRFSEDAGEDISKMPEETQNYVPSVMEKYANFKGSTANNDIANTTVPSIDANAIFNGIDDSSISGILTDFNISAMEDEDYYYPGMEALIQHGIDNDKLTKEAAQLVLDSGISQFAAYLEDEIAKPDNKLAQKMAESAATAKDIEGMSRIQNALNTGDTPVIKQVANKYRQQLGDILSNIRSAEAKPVNTKQALSNNAQQQRTTKLNDIQSGNTINQKKLAQPQINTAHNQNMVPATNQPVNSNVNVNANISNVSEVTRAEQRKQAEELQDLWSRQHSNMAHIQAMAMDDIPQSKPQRVQQAQAIQQIAEVNNVQLPKAIKPGLEAGAVKAIEKAQELIAPSLEDVKGGNTNESVKSTEGSQTTSTEGINTENQVQHTESEQGKAPAEVSGHNPVIETGTHVNTKTGKTQYKAVIHEKLDWKRLKELAKKHHGGYSRFAKAYLFNNEADRDSFAADVDREFFTSDKQDETPSEAPSNPQVNDTDSVNDTSTSKKENDDYHGFLDGKGQFETDKIKEQLEENHLHKDEQSGRNIYYNEKELVEQAANENVTGTRHGSYCYIQGVRVSIPAYEYYQYLRYNTDHGQKGQNVNSSNKKAATNSGSVVVTGDEFGAYKDVAELRKKALKYYSDNLQGTTVENAKLGTIDIDEIGAVSFTGSGKSKVKNTSAKEEKLLLVKHLPQLIHKATDITEKGPEKAKHSNDYFYYLNTAAIINGTKIPVVITLIKRNDKHIQFYNHTLPSLENDNKNEPLVSSAPESSIKEALGTPTVNGSIANISQEQEESKENSTDDYYGFLNSKKTGEVTEIKYKLLEPVDTFGASKGVVNVKSLMESLAKSGAQAEKRGIYYYIRGERVSKAAYSYFQHLKRIGYGNDEEVSRNSDNQSEIKKATNDGDELPLTDGYRTESGKPLSEADKDEFILDTNGNEDIGAISQDISAATNGLLKAAPIRLQVGDKDYGYIHLLKHTEQIKSKGYELMGYIRHILDSFDQVYSQQNPDKPNRFVLYCKDNSKGFMPIDLELERNKNNYYTIVSVMPHKAKIKGTLIFDGSANPSIATTNDTLLVESDNNGGVTTSTNTHGENNVPVTSNVAENDKESKKESWIDNYFPDDMEDKPGDSQQKREWHKLYNTLRSIALKIESAEAQGDLPDINYIKSFYEKYQDNEGVGSDARLDTVAKNHYKLVLDAREDKKKELEKAGETTTRNGWDKMMSEASVDTSDASTNTTSQTKENKEVEDSIFGEYNEDELFKVLGITAVDDEEATLSAPDNISNTAEERERLERELAAEFSKISANPVFNPRIYSLGLQLGFTYIKDGYNNAKKWLAKMHQQFGDNIAPWAPAILKTIQDWPAGEPFNEKIAAYITKNVGALYESGEHTSLNYITHTITQRMSANDKKRFTPIIEAAYNGIKVFFDNMEEVKNNGQEQKESESSAGGYKGLQSKATEGVKEGENRSDTVSGGISRQSRGEGVSDAGDIAGRDSGKPRLHAEVAGRGEGKNDRSGARERGDKQPATVNSEPAKTVIANQPAGNYEIKEAAAGKSGEKERYRQNVEAIKLLKQLESENRMPTAKEQDILAAYNGWGGLKNAFLDDKMNKELKELLTDKEYEAARATINDAFYTSPDTVKAIWKGVSHLGFKGGRVLDPSMGIGNFFGCMPRDIMSKSTLQGVELDDLTARLAKKLYPNAFVEHKGFQDSKAPDNYYDLVISNIPFGTTKIQGYNIHNFFFANGMDKVRPGGLMVFITSQGTLTNGSDGARMRSYLSEQADMIAAYKLPEGTFKDAGTDVVTDVIIMQKRGEDGKPSPYAQKFTDVGSFRELAIKFDDIKLNNYFEKHREHILGRAYPKRTAHGKTVGVRPAGDISTAEALSQAMEKLPADVYREANSKKAKALNTIQTVNTVAAEEGTRDYEYYEKDGKLYQRTRDTAQEITNSERGADKKRVEIIKGILKIKAAMKKLIAAQYDPAVKEADLDKMRKELNKVYDAFVKKYGYLNSETPKRLFKDDPSAGMLQALERPMYETIKSTNKSGKTTTRKKLIGVEKAAIFSKRIIDPIEEVTKADSPADALLYSLNNQGSVDLEYMAKLLKSTPEGVANALKGQIYKNPATGQYETKDEYLSGNVRQKLEVAELEVQNNEAYRDNVEALKKVVPEDLVSDEIIVNMGSPWIPETDIQDYVDYLTRGNGSLSVGYSHAAAKWNVAGYAGPNPRFDAKGIKLDALLYCILNNKAIEVNTKAFDGGEYKTVLDREATDAANVVADDIRNDFKEWIWQDKEREQRLVRYYNDNYNNTVNRDYDGTHLTFPGKNPSINLDPHQKNVVWRMLQKGNTLIAHCVGAGKTFSMQAAGMEMRRLGIARKPMYCLPNNVVEQFTREFRLLYPNAKILMLTNNDLPAVPQTATTKKSDGRMVKVDLPIDAAERNKILEKRAERTRTLSRIQTEDWDAIVISHNLFERFPVSPETAADFVREELQNVENAIMEAKGASFGKKDLSTLENRKKALQEKLEKLLNVDITNIGIPFEELGIDQLFVDEADLFKNLAYTSTMDRISGLANSNANRSTDMFMKTQWLTRTMGGRGVVFATGTPISNTMAEMYTMMRYMDMQGLKEKGLDLFDRWCAAFAEIGAGIERKPTGDGFRKINKVKRFINMADLTTMFRKFADVKTQEDLNLNIPELKNGKSTVVTLKPDPDLVHYIKHVVPQRVAKMKKGFKQEKGADNMLALTNDLRKMSLNDAKIEACADMITKKYEETTDVNGAQLVFCDQGIPRAEKDNEGGNKSQKGENNEDVLDNEAEQENTGVYTELMEALKRRGIPEDQIAFIQSAKTKPQMDALFQRVDKGELRILIGSTQKMGAGTNCQHHLVALHDLDAPWRPRDLEQRHGRILRRGNQNKEVEIFNYVVQDSFDANMWEKLKNKAAIIAQAMSGDTQIRAVEDADLVTLGYAEIEGAATGNPLIKEQLKLNNEVTKYANAQKIFKKQQAAAQQVIEKNPQIIENLKAVSGEIQKDITARADTRGDKFKAVIAGKTYTERTKAEAALKKSTDKFNKKAPTEIGEIGGFKIIAEYSENSYAVGGEEAGGNVSLRLDGNVPYSVKTPSIKGLENALQSQPEARLKATNEVLKAAENELTAAKEQVNKTYPHAEKLKEMQKRLNEINREIEKSLVDNGREQEEAAKDAGETDDKAFSVAENSENRQLMSTEEFEAAVHAAFPGAKSFQSKDDTVTFELPNGSRVTVNLVDNVAFSDEARKKAARDYGRNIGENESAEGSYAGVGCDGFITLSKGGRVGTIFHEAYHMAKRTVLTSREKEFLSKRYENEEAEAEAYREWRLARDHQGMFGKIWRKIKAFAENMANILGIETKGYIFRGIESGESFKRKANTDNFANTDGSVKHGDVHYSIAPVNSNTKQGLVQRLKNRFWNGNSRQVDTYRQQAKAILQDLTQAKISWGKLDDDTKVIYKELQGVIRVGKPYDWGNMMPTVGSIVAERLGINKSEEMNNYIADWILTGAIGNNSKEATEFAKAMKQNAYMSDKLLDVQNLFMQHSDQITHDFHQNVVSFEQPRERTGAKEWLDDFYDNWIEELGPVKRMVEAIEKSRKSKLPAGINPYTWFRLLRGHYGKAITMIEGDSQKAVTALQQLFPNVDFTGFKTLNMIMRNIGATGNKAKRKAFSEYCVAKHLLDIHQHNNEIREQQKQNKAEIKYHESLINDLKLKEPNIADNDYRIKKIQDDIAEIEAVNKSLEADIMATPMPEKKCQEIIDNAPDGFLGAQQDIVHYSNTLMSILYDSGIIGEKRYRRTLDKWPNYVPMFRVFEENEDVQFGDSLKAQSGSSRQVIDPMESLVKNTFDFVKRAERNKCKLMVANLARCSGVGEYIDITDVKGNPDLRDTVSFYIDGHKRYLVTDPSVVKAINGMDRDNSGTLLKILQWPVKLGRACFVLVNPAFAARNIFRDGADATIYAKYGFTPKDMLEGLLHAIHKDDVYYEWLASGAAQASAISVDRKYAQSTLDNMTMSTKEKLLTPRKWLDILQAAGEYSEYATRIGAYQRAKEGAMVDGMTTNGAILVAAMESRDLMDFARGGRKSRSLNKVSLFANAAIQGWDKFFRTFDPRDKKTFMRAAARLAFTAILPSLALTLLFRGDDWWEELPDWMKENNWVMKIGNTIIRIPKGQDIGLRFFSSFVEKAIGKNSKVSATGVLKPLYEALPSITPFALLPIFEAMADHSFFTDGSVVPGYLSKLPADKQYNTSTSMLSRLIGEATGISPMKIDHVLYGYTGNVSRGANEFINWIGKDKKSMPNLTDLPVINGLTYMPYKNPASVTKFYDKWDKAQREHALYKQTGKVRDGYTEAEYKRLKDANDKMSELAKKERAIVANEKLSNAKQYEMQMKIQQQRMKLAEKFKD